MIRWNSNIAGFSRHHAFGFEANFPTHIVISVSSPVFVSVGKIFLFADAEWNDVLDFFLEVTLRATAGVAVARLFDVTAGAPVTNSVITTTSSTSVRVRSSALTLVDGNEYQIQFGSNVSSAGAAFGGQLIAK